MQVTRTILMAVTVGLVGLLGFALSHAAPEPQEVVQNGAKIFNARCSTCHCVPDERVERDAHWLKLITTTW